MPYSMCIFNAVRKQSGIGFIVDALFGYFVLIHFGKQSLFDLLKLFTMLASKHHNLGVIGYTCVSYTAVFSIGYGIRI